MGCNGIKGRRMLFRKGVGFTLLFLSAMGCSSDPAVKGVGSAHYTESGKASYYANRFQGRKTASGERYDRAKMTAAHKKLPFGTNLKVTNVKNGKSVIVRVNDRGPFVKRRIIDLSRSAFKAISKLEAGVIDVKIQVVE